MDGDEALFQYCLFLLPTTILTYCFGVPMLTPKERQSTTYFVRLLNPTIVALFLGFFLSISGINQYIPNFAYSVVSSLKACSGPLLMFLMSFVIAGFNYREILTNKKIYIATMLRLFIIPATLMLILHLLSAPKSILEFALFAFGTPLGLYTVVIPASYGEDTKIGSSMAAVSSSLSMLSLPIMYSLLNIIL